MGKQKSTTFLKVMSIIMIVGGALEAIAGIISFGAVGAMALLEISLGILYFVAALVIVSAVAYLVAGIVGLKACKAPAKVKKCLIWGVLCILPMIVSNVVGGIWGAGFKVQDLLIGLILPVLYIVAALPLRSK